MAEEKVTVEEISTDIKIYYYDLTENEIFIGEDELKEYREMYPSTKDNQVIELVERSAFEQLGRDKASNDEDYLKLSVENNALRTEIGPHLRETLPLLKTYDGEPWARLFAQATKLVERMRA